MLPHVPHSLEVLGYLRVNDEIWAATTVAVLLGFWMYADLISSTTFSGETWSGCRVRLCQEELDSMRL